MPHAAPNDDLVTMPIQAGQTCFLSGPAGAGKTAVLAARLAYLLDQGVPAYSILVLLPDRPAREQLQRTLQGIALGPYGNPSLYTFYSLAQRMVALFWPLVARPVGFAHPEKPPVFMTYELAQHHMRRIVAPLLEQGYFEGLHLHPQRLVSQLLDNLNKAALNGYPIAQVVVRLTSTWSGPPERLIAFEQAQECIRRFRRDCLERGLLDLSLTLKAFQQLVDTPPFWGYFSERYRHLLVDNVEESVPIAQDFIARLLPHCDSALLVLDEEGGYRTLLGADPQGAQALRRLCGRRVRAPGPLAPAAPLAAAVAARLGQGPTESAAAAWPILGHVQTRFRSAMLTEVAAALAYMVHEEKVPPAEIAVIAPYLDGVLRFALAQACALLGVPLRILRRYRRPAEEPAVRALVTLATLLHPEWGVVPPRYDVAETLDQVLVGLDPVRAALLADWTYDPVGPAWRMPDTLPGTARARLGPELLACYYAFWQRWQEILPDAGMPWEHLLARLLGVFLAEAARAPAVATACAELIESARRFRQAFPVLQPDDDPATVGQHYLETLRSGVVTAQYLVRDPLMQPPAPPPNTLSGDRGNGAPDDRFASEGLDTRGAPTETGAADRGAVLVAPAQSYLLSGAPVRRQFWLDLASMDWWTPPQQPLTNPYVLSRRWPAGAPWDDAADYTVRQAALARTVQGLCNRCREGIVFCTSTLGTAGQAQDGPLMRVLESIVLQNAGPQTDKVLDVDP
jgi:hypothetical protein